MSTEVQTAAETARRGPLVQFVIVKAHDAGGAHYRVERSDAGSKPSHWLIHPPVLAGSAITLEGARMFVPSGFKRMDRRKDDRVDVVEVWV